MSYVVGKPDLNETWVHFDKLNFNYNEVAQLHNKRAWSEVEEIDLKHFVLLANCRRWLCQIDKVISLKNKVGPRMLPCGTPEITGIVSERLLLFEDDLNTPWTMQLFQPTTTYSAWCYEKQSQMPCIYQDKLHQFVLDC